MVKSESERLKSFLLLSSFKSFVLKDDLIVVLSPFDSSILLVSIFLSFVSVFVLSVVSISLLKLPFSVLSKSEFEFDKYSVDSDLSFVDSEFISEESDLNVSFSFWVEPDIISEFEPSFIFEVDSILESDISFGNSLLVLCSNCVFVFELEVNWVETEFLFVGKSVNSLDWATSFFSNVVSCRYVVSSDLLSIELRLLFGIVISVEGKLVFVLIFVVYSELLYELEVIKLPLEYEESSVVSDIYVVPSLSIFGKDELNFDALLNLGTESEI